MKDIQKIEPIAYIHTDFKEKFGVPRQSGRVEELIGKIVFEKKYRISESLKGIEEFSHLWLIFGFSKVEKEEWSPTIRPPRLGGNKRVGVFASRSPFRPNKMGLSSVKLLKVENEKENGDVLIVSGVDIIDMTPIYDIKPYIKYTDCHIDAVSSYADENFSHKLDVEFDNSLLNLIPDDKKNAVIACIKDDPRPSYQNDSERIYSMAFSDFDIHFKVDGKKAKIIGVDKK
ncbi:MAG: tRNA (N6-threonylcarbamoyladenosine(37)-N6)-methyltransferase TrmO [Ruminococcaceae bacterium]|nr:tRNA (N6-threonylcarbamoyladenosine(37)-N6)-methyltransferase TrmO [Oscillospiraceae bacterium]